MLKKIILPILMFTSFALADGNTAQKPNVKVEISATTIDGKTFSFKGKQTGLDMPDNLKGKVVLVEFWGTHCPPCLRSIPHYIDLNKKYKGKLEMLAFEVQGTQKANLEKFVKEKGINYNIFTQEGNSNFLRYLGTRAGWRGAIPYLIIFDTEGNAVTVKIGMVSAEYIENVVKAVLKDKSDKKSNTDSNTTK